MKHHPAKGPFPKGNPDKIKSDRSLENEGNNQFYAPFNSLNLIVPFTHGHKDSDTYQYPGHRNLVSLS